MFFRWALGLILLAGISFCATFGTVVPVIGGAADLVLDEARGRLYLVNTNQNRVEVYSTAQRRLLAPIPTDSIPLAAALSRSGAFLYVTSQGASAIDIIDLTAQTVVQRVTLPAKPEGIAVGADERVLISTIGSGAGNSQNVLLIFDPNAQDPNSALQPVPVTPLPPALPQLPPPSGKQFQAARSALRASADGLIIAGANIPVNGARAVFVYEVASGSVLRSRLVLNSSGVLAVNQDGSKFMSGAALFDAKTLQVLAQENMANAPYLIAAGTQFNLESLQGGSVFRPDGSALYSAFDIAPQTVPPTASNVSQLMLNDPDNLLIQTAFQLPENLSGKMVISSDGSALYALSDSGFLVIPLSTIPQSPQALPDRTSIVLANDQCGVNAAQRTARVTVSNAGAGRLTVTAQVLQTGPPVPGAAVPQVRVQQSGSGANVDFTFNTAATQLGTAAPGFDFILQSPEAINIPPRVHVYQNVRNAEAVGAIIPRPLGINTGEGLQDIVYDATRQRLYITNSGMNRVEVFDIRQNAFLSPVKVGQLPHYMALTPDGNTLYVANTGGESISIVDPDQLRTVGQVRFPPTPISVAAVLSTPAEIAAGQRGPLFMMSTTAANGLSTATIWQIIGDQALPRPASPVIGGANGVQRAIPGPRSMVATPGGEFILLAGTDGLTYLYDASADEFVQSRQLGNIAQAQGYFGPATAGPRGQYYVLNGQVLNSALTPISTRVAGSRLVASVVAINNNTYAQLTVPVRANNTIAPPDAGLLETVDASSGVTTRSIGSLEGPSVQPVGAGRATPVNFRALAIDSSGTAAYALTASGLSIISLAPPAPASAAPQVSPRGVVNAASYQTSIAQNGLASIFGRNLGDNDAATSVPLPYILGGVCVTLNNQPLPLFVTTPGQINVQVPPEQATGNFPLVVRAIGKALASPAQTVAISKYAPAVFMDPVSGQVALVHADGSFVTSKHPAHRDEPLVLYAAGLGLTTGGKVTGGNAAPSSPLAVTAPIQVFFGPPTYSQAPVIVDFSGLTPGFVGLYQLNLRIPGDHIKGDSVPITLKIGGISSPGTGPLVPTVTVE